MKEQSKNNHEELIKFVDSLTEAQIEKIISHLDEIKELLAENQ